MKPLVLDVETTGATNDTIGNPFTDGNRLCYFGCIHDSFWSSNVDVCNQPYGEKITLIQHRIDLHDLLVGFNLKFDLHWLLRYGVDFGSNINFWDCQLAHFIITGQLGVMPSLNQVSAYCGFGQKIDSIKEKYWNKGIDTDQIPEAEVKEYLKQDVLLTKQIFDWQIEYLKDKQQLKRLIWYSCQDLKTTLEMERNGIYCDFERAKNKSIEIERRIGIIDQSLRSYVSDVPVNWNSDDHLSAVLYGGTIREDFQVVDGVYKGGARAGQPKLKWQSRVHNFPRLVNPIKGTELKKEGVWSTASGVLPKLKATGKAKEIIKLVQERSTLETKRSRYFDGFPDLYKKMDWTGNLIHSQFSHVTAQSGRLGSSKPNVQNLEDEMRECIVTRF